jgi:hypothetical protein
MSTRLSVEHGEGFHLFTDLFDGRNVYLELHGVEFTGATRLPRDPL